MNHRVSVILPIFNAQNYIAEALDSVIKQDYPIYEIITVDDGSTDDSRNKILGFSKENGITIKYIYQNNLGPAAARNKGINESSGDYIAFLDADDLWETTKLQKQFTHMEQHPLAAMCFTDISHIVNGKRVHASYLHERPYKYLREGNVYENLLRQNFIFTPTVLVKKEVLAKTGMFDQTLRIGEDYDLWLRIAREFLICFVDEALVTRRRTGQNITGDKKQYIEYNMSLHRRILKREASIPYRCEIIEEKLRYYQFSLAYEQFIKGLFQEARKSFFSIIKHKSFTIKSIFYIMLTFLPVNLVMGLRGHAKRT